MTNTVLSAEPNVPSHDVTKSDDFQRPLRVSAEIDVRDLDATEKFERYITGEEKLF